VWYSVHCYDYGDHDTLLMDHIGPKLVERSRYFFVRYWEGGPHIRLRLDTQDERSFLDLVDGLRDSGRPAVPLAGSFQRTQRVLALLEDKHVEDTDAVPHGQVCVAGYQPEYGKYGGPRGVAIAEDLFVTSSRLCLDLLPVMSRGGARRLVLGVSTMVAALVGAGMAQHEITEFLGRYTHVWSGYVTRESWRSFPTRAVRDRVTVADTVSEVLAGGGDPVVIEWRNAVARTVRAVRAEGEALLGDVAASGPLSGLHFLVCHYLHTHDNRLGVLPDEEAYLAYLARHVLETR
jgi:thiopeptide-type bacteriocin biosynthesis protein